MPEQVINVPFIHVANFTFNVMMTVAIDRTRFFVHQDIVHKVITLHLQGGVKHDFEGADAIEFNKWFTATFNPAGLTNSVKH